MSKRLAESLYIKVEFVDKLDENNAFDGDCGYEDEDVRPKEFVIRVNNTLTIIIIVFFLSNISLVMNNKSVLLPAAGINIHYSV
jgi:hypothetical protein